LARMRAMNDFFSSAIQLTEMKRGAKEWGQPPIPRCAGK
jgi:hypothetical protein